MSSPADPFSGTRTPPRMRPVRLAALAALLAAAPAVAQQGGKRPLTPADFDQWRSIRNESLSRNGEWAVFSLVPQVGEGEVVVRSTRGTAEHRHTRGFIGRPQTRPGATGPMAGYNAPPPRISADSRWVVFTIDPPRDSVEAARRARRTGDRAPKSGLGILSLADGRVQRVARVKNFRMPEENGRWLAYLLEGDSTSAARRDTTARPDTAAASAAATPGGTPRPISTDTARGAKKKDPGTTLVLRDLSTGAETRVDEVAAYAFDEGGRWLAYTVSSRDRARDGAYVRQLASGRTHALATGFGEYKGLAFDRRGTQLAFVSNRDEYARPRTRWALFHAALGATPRAREVVAEDGAGSGLVVSDRGTIRFTRDGRVLAFGVAPTAPDSVPADSLADKAVFDLWHWREPRLQPQQRAEADDNRGRAWLAVLHGAQGRPVVIENDTLQDAELSEDGLRALVVNPAPYAVSAMWGEGGSDVYAVDTRTGRRTRVATQVRFDPQLSADGRFIAWWDGERHWNTHEIAAGRTTRVTARTPGVRWDQETWDTPSLPAPYGIAGWTAGDRSMLVYDRYDVWELDPQGRRPARVVTDSVGRRGRMALRMVDLDPEERSIDPARPLYFQALADETKAGGFWRDDLRTNAPPTRLVMEDRRFGSLRRARDADVFLFTRQTVQEFPDLWAAGPDLAAARRLSDANPQQGRYLWPSVELVRWRSDDGVELKGLLHRPADFDPAKQYPMVVYHYEQLSDNLHAYAPPAGRNVINPTVYASNGYLVFTPDIHYSEGFPGASALKSIVPGVQSLIRRGFVEPEGVGIQGQSWGGYQAAYIITRTPLFRAAMAGAPVANMTSAYGGIRWQTGLARPFQYERGQSRIGGSLWERPWHYVENSPLFSADRVTTPLLMMHNDADGAVPWQQGIEMFVALRRLGKEVYLINYNGDEHNPTKRANQIDVSVRMMQFFDHHLRGRPAPEWMRRGIPFLDKGRDQLAAPAAQPTATPQPGEPPAPAGTEEGTAP